jgi:hypothetical protein
VQLKKEAPFSNTCSVCGCETLSPVHCYDCDHCVQYCLDCEIKSHSNISFHKPEIRKVKYNFNNGLYIVCVYMSLE